MKLFITGGCGFIGSNFILNQGIKKADSILNYDKLSYSGNINNLSSINNNDIYSFIKGDICDINKLNKTIIDFEPDIIIHFAAESHVDRSIDSPFDFIDTNIIGTANLLHAASSYNKKIGKLKKFIHISTDEVYGSLEETGSFNEKSPIRPNSPYAASKASSDLLVRSWGKTYNFPFIITHCSNNYGPFQFPEKLIPLMIANCIDNKPLPIYGNGKNIRDWLHVNDHCRAIFQIVLKGKVGEVYDIGGGAEKSNIEIVSKICMVLDKLRPRSEGYSYKDLITFVKDRPGHDFRYAISSSKIQNELNWKPIESFDTGIYKTIEWYLENESWWRNIQEINYNQERLGLKKS